MAEETDIIYSAAMRGPVDTRSFASRIDCEGVKAPAWASDLSVAAAETALHAPLR